MIKQIPLLLLALCAAGTASAGVGPAWAWDAGKLPNGKVLVKSSNGVFSYDVQQNPVGSVAQVNQSALTQPPTVIVQATANMPFNYADNCYLMVINGYGWFMGSGIVDKNGLYSGVIGWGSAIGNWNVAHTRYSGQFVAAATIGGGTGNGTTNPSVCTTEACIWSNLGNDIVTIALSVPLQRQPYRCLQ